MRGGFIYQGQRTPEEKEQPKSGHGKAALVFVVETVLSQLGVPLEVLVAALPALLCWAYPNLRQMAAANIRASVAGGLVFMLLVVGLGQWWRRTHPSAKMPVAVDIAREVVRQMGSGNSEQRPATSATQAISPPTPQPQTPSAPAPTGPVVPTVLARRERVSATSVQFARPENRNGISPFVGNQPVSVRGRIVNQGTETARSVAFHVYLMEMELPPSEETEEVAWKSYTGMIRGQGREVDSDLGTSEDRYEDAETARLTIDEAAHLNAGRYHMYFLGIATYRDKDGRLSSEMCFYWDPGGVWRRCTRHNRVGLIFRP